MNKKTFSLISVLVIAIAAYLLFFSGIMPKKTRIVLVAEENSILKEICEDFNKENKDIKLDYLEKDSYDAEDYIGSGKGDIWIPEDAMSIKYAQDDYRYDNKGSELYGRFTKIAYTPMIFVSAKQRYQYTSQMTLQDIYSNAAGKKSWDEINGKLNWGSFRFGCANPYTYPHGADFISLFIHDYYRAIGEPRKVIGMKELDDEGLREYIKPFIANISLRGHYGNSFLYDYFREEEAPLIDMCPSYEHVFLDTIAYDADAWSNVRIHYPEPTISMPIYLISLDNSLKNTKKADAIKRFEDYMLSDDVQKKLFNLGYRPVNAAVADLKALEDKYGDYGIRAEMPELIDSINYDFMREFQKTMGKFVPAISD